jgi:hypothetical protein
MPVIEYTSPRTGRVWVVTPDDLTKEPTQESHEYIAKKVEQIETGNVQGPTGAFCASLAQGVTKLPGVIWKRIGSFIGDEVIEQDGRYWEMQARECFATDPMRRDDISVKMGELLGPIGFVLFISFLLGKRIKTFYYKNNNLKIRVYYILMNMRQLILKTTMSKDLVTNILLICILVILAKIWQRMPPTIGEIAAVKTSEERRAIRLRQPAIAVENTVQVDMGNSVLDVNVKEMVPIMVEKAIDVNVQNDSFDVNVTNSDFDVNVKNTDLDVNVSNIYPVPVTIEGR